MNLPQSTIINRPLPKKAIYAKFGLKTAQQERFDADVSRIVLTNEVTPQTTAIAAGNSVAGFFVAEVYLKTNDFDRDNIKLLSKLIPQNILFLLKHENQAMLAVYNTKLVCTEWDDINNTTIHLIGLDFDAVWDNIVKSMLNVQCLILNYEWNDSLTVEENILQCDAKAKLIQKIELLEARARKEKQPKKKLALVEEIRKLMLNV